LVPLIPFPLDGYYGFKHLKVKELTSATFFTISFMYFQVYYQNLRGLHWNIRGKRFFDLHVKFEELYNDSQLKIDLIAERVLTLGGTPLHTFEDYINNSKLAIGKDIHKDEEAISLILSSLSSLLKIERVILKQADEIIDEGTNSMMSDFISEQEKTIWMMRAWLEQDI
jgi:starvation-inducible DNA-binding protein